MYVYYRDLGVSTNATDQEIREAYLKKVRIHTPEKNPEQFRIISESYEKIKDIRSRIHNRLFSMEDFPDMEEGIARIAGQTEIRRRRPTLEELLSLETRS